MSPQFANLTTSLNPLDADKGRRGTSPAEPGSRATVGLGRERRPLAEWPGPCAPDEEEEEEEESEDELPQDIALAAGSESPALGPEALEPPAKLARTDARGLFVQALPSS